VNIFLVKKLCDDLIRQYDFMLSNETINLPISRKDYQEILLVLRCQISSVRSNLARHANLSKLDKILQKEIAVNDEELAKYFFK
jgi:hypothetical protein